MARNRWWSGSVVLSPAQLFQTARSFDQIARLEVEWLVRYHAADGDTVVTLQDRHLIYVVRLRFSRQPLASFSRATRTGTATGAKSGV